MSWQTIVAFVLVLLGCAVAELAEEESDLRKRAALGLGLTGTGVLIAWLA